MQNKTEIIMSQGTDARKCYFMCIKCKCAVLTNFSGVSGIVHDRLPALEGGHLEQGNVGMTHVVKCDLRVDPFGVVLG